MKIQIRYSSGMHYDVTLKPELIGFQSTSCWLTMYQKKTDPKVTPPMVYFEKLTKQEARQLAYALLSHAETL